MRKKLVIVAVLIALAIPIGLFLDWQHGRQDVVDQAESYFSEIPEYPNIVYKSTKNTESFYSLGYSRDYMTKDSWEDVLAYYQKNVNGSWKLIKKSTDGDDKTLKYDYKNSNFSLIIQYYASSEVGQTAGQRFVVDIYKQ
jgi:hypothetical protein